MDLDLVSEIRNCIIVPLGDYGELLLAVDVNLLTVAGREKLLIDNILKLLDQYHEESER